MRFPTHWLLASAVVLSTNLALAQAVSRFEEFDKNNDGKLSRDELPEGIRGNFDRLDTDKDGSISRAEETAFLARMNAAPKAQARAFQAPASVTIENDIPYAGTKNPRQMLDLVLPKTPKNDKPLPVIVIIHGGAWRAGDKTSGLGQASNFASKGEYAAVTVGYRLTQEASWPAQIDDCKAAIRWVRANAGKYNLDPDKIGVIGGSAGGHLVAMLGTSGGVESVEGDLGPHKGISSKVQCVVDEFGPAELLTMGDGPGNEAHNAPRSPESILVGGPIQERKDVARAASPITYVSKDDPPFLIIHGDKDPTVPFDQSVKLHAALKKAGVDVLFLKVEGGGHGGFRNPEIPRRIRQFFDKNLRGMDVGAISEEPVPNAAAVK